MANIRHQLTMTDIQLAIAGVAAKTDYRSKQKGIGVMASGHEILGIIEDEVQEYRDEVHAKSDAELKIEELKDIAVAAIWELPQFRAAALTGSDQRLN